MCKYSARIDTLWMCAGKCGVAIGAAYRPLLLIHAVGSRLRVTNLSAYTELKRWLALCVMGLSRAERGLWWQAQPVGKRAIAANAWLYTLLATLCKP